MKSFNIQSVPSMPVCLFIYRMMHFLFAACKIPQNCTRCHFRFSTELFWLVGWILLLEVNESSKKQTRQTSHSIIQSTKGHKQSIAHTNTKKIHEAAHEFSRTQGCIEYSNIRIFGRRWFIRTWPPNIRFIKMILNFMPRLWNFDLQI